MEIEDKCFGVHFAFGEFIDVVLHIWFKEKVEKFVFHVLLMYLSVNLSLFYYALGDCFRWRSFPNFLVEEEISVLLFLFIISERILLNTAKRFGF